MHGKAVTYCEPELVLTLLDDALLMSRVFSDCELVREATLGMVKLFPNSGG